MHEEGPKWHARTALALDWLGMACLIMGVIGDVINRTPGLEPTNWFIMAIALWVWGLAAWLAAYFVAKEG